MGSAYALYPTLTDDLRTRVRFQGDEYIFSYETGMGKQNLQADITDTNGGYPICILSDPHGRWHPDQYNWELRRTIRILTPSYMFGALGLVPNEARVGLALQWVSQTSKQRGVVRIGDFGSDDRAATFEVYSNFHAMQLRGRVLLSILLYVARATANPGIDEVHLANTAGTILGEVECICVVLDGEGSIFPIVEVSEPVQPLWYLVCDWENPLADSFMDCVRLNLNKSHRAYPCIDQNSDRYDDRLMSEIMASALTILITKLKESSDWPDIEGGQNLAHGSVGEAVFYFISTLEWVVSSPEALSISIRKYLDKNM